MSDKFDKFNTTVSTILGEMKQMRKRNQILNKKNEKLTTEVQLLQIKIDELEQKTLDKAVEIVGIPITPNKNYKLIVEEVIQKIKIKIM